MEELPTTFLDEHKSERTVRINVPTAYDFCRKHNLSLSGLVPGMLNSAQLLELAFLGTRFNAKSAGETLEQFFDAIDGQALLRAEEAAARALINFSLRILPPERAALLRLEHDLLAEGVSGEELVRRLRESLGAGETSSASAEAPA